MSMRAPLALLLLLAVALPLPARDLFFKLERYVLPTNSTLRVHAFNGTFAGSENGIARDRVSDISVVAGGVRTRLPKRRWTSDRKSSSLTLLTGAAGTYVVGASILPRDLSMQARAFDAYLQEEGVLDLLAERTATQARRPVRERYAKYVKAIFQVGEQRSDDFAATLGHAAEIVPLANPYALRAGDTLRVRCLVDQRPLAGHIVLAGWESTEARPVQHAVRTDADGIAAIPLSATGRWYAKFVSVAHATAPRLDFESKWATLTFEIR